MAVEQKFTWRGSAVQETMLDAALDGVVASMEYALQTANRTVPILNSPLMQSGIASSERKGDEIAGAVSYSTPYAARQHEDLTFRHAPGRRAKWLELTFVEQQDTLSRLVAAEVRRRVGGPL